MIILLKKEAFSEINNLLYTNNVETHPNTFNKIGKTKTITFLLLKLSIMAGRSVKIDYTITIK